MYVKAALVLSVSTDSSSESGKESGGVTPRGIAAGAAAVSYTHLDVYKRQFIFSVVMVDI